MGSEVRQLILCSLHGRLPSSASPCVRRSRLSNLLAMVQGSPPAFASRSQKKTPRLDRGKLATARLDFRCLHRVTTFQGVSNISAARDSSPISLVAALPAGRE